MFKKKTWLYKLWKCCNPSLGLTTKAKACKSAGQERSPWVWESVRMNTHTPKWTSILFGSWGPGWFSELQRAIARFKNPLPWWSSFISLENYWNVDVQNELAWPIWTSYNISYGQKKGRESNWQFDSRPWKVANWFDSLACRWRVTRRWKALNKGYNFGSDPIPIEGLHKNL
jgi:hypothetical protein